MSLFRTTKTRVTVQRQMIALSFTLLLGLCTCQSLVAQDSVPQGAAIASSRPAAQPSTVLVIALEGFGWDLPGKDDARNLLALGNAGVWAPQGMIPAYPAQSLPNLYTVVTGLYPGHHGIVADSFYDPTRKEHFSAADAKTVVDGAWYGGVPLWSLAEKQGIRTACMGWAGCAAEIGGARPTYVRDAAKNSAGIIEEVEKWLRLPPEKRPRLITIALSEPGEAGVEYGPDAPQTRAAVRHADEWVGALQSSLKKTGLPIDLVVLSDRGIAKPDGGWITLDTDGDLRGMETVGALLYGANEQDREHAYNQLKKATSEFMAYRLKSLPAELHLAGNPRLGDPVLYATGAYAIRARPGSGNAIPPRGVDGFDPEAVPAMKTIFFAAGPDIVKGKTVAPFENVNLFPWLAHMLGIHAPKVDGSLNILSGTLRDNGDNGQ